MQKNDKHRRKKCDGCANYRQKKCDYTCIMNLHSALYQRCVKEYAIARCVNVLYVSHWCV